MPAYLILALIAAAFYSVGSLLSKQAMANSCGPLRIYMMQAWFGAVLLSPFLFAGDPVPINLWWQPVLAAILWFGGSAIFIYTLRNGDLSIIGPVAGIKPVFNAILIALLLRIHVPLSTWLACGLAAVALFVMRTPSSFGSHSFKRTAIQTLAAMFLYALTDICLQRWAPAWGALRFSAFLFLSGAVLSLSLIPRFGKKFCDLSFTAKRFLFAGSFLTCLPGICIGFAIGTYGHGAEVNVGYSLHVLMSLLIVWFIGRHIGNLEHTAGGKAFLRRLSGALILLLAIAMILSD
ncbi:MAG: DMT family transporter [Verrucomicrobia bacterium]|nr:DMT family transporter [Verrucomicrobiota bacterium]